MLETPVYHQYKSFLYHKLFFSSYFLLALSFTVETTTEVTNRVPSPILLTIPSKAWMELSGRKKSGFFSVWAEVVRKASLGGLVPC